MWIRMTRVKMDAENREIARDLYNSGEVSGVISEHKGYRFHYLLENVDDDTESISITAWNTEADALSYENSGAYAELVGKFMALMTEPPVLSSYEVLE